MNVFNPTIELTLFKSEINPNHRGLRISLGLQGVRDLALESQNFLKNLYIKSLPEFCSFVEKKPTLFS